jgi:nitronate monooxygenase
MRFGDRYSLRLGDKEYLPLMQGGMGVDISTASLALEICRLGGIGHISDAMSPYVNDKYLKTRYQSEKAKSFTEEITPAGVPNAAWAPDVVYEANKRYCAETMSKKRGPGAVFVNVMEKLTMGNPSDTLRARLRGALDGGIDGITLSAGLHNGSLKLIEDHPRFRDAKIGIIVSSARALAIFLRGASRVKRMPDYIVVEGPLAGGHLGFGDDWANYTLEEIVVEVKQALDAAELKIPIIAAGGVFDGGDAMNVCDLGASAIQVATRFTISNECGIPALIKQKYLAAREQDLDVNNLSPTGYLMRMLKSSPCMASTIKPNCAGLGYLLDKDGKCSYHTAYENSGFDANGNKLPVKDKMCICYHFMKYNCYTCGHNVIRLKDTVRKDITTGAVIMPSAEEVFMDYMYRSFEQAEYGEVLQRAAAGM